MTATAIGRVLTKLDNSIAAGNYYEAHQMYRTLYFRYTAQRKYEECLDLLFNGALKLLAKQQETSAADLGLLLIDTLEKRGASNCSDVDLWIERFGKIIGMLSSSTVERDTLIARAVKWSGDESGGNSFGHPTMHKLIGQIFWSENNSEQARHHYLLSRDGNLCGRILIKISRRKGYSSELDLFIAQAVLQQLCLKDRRTAEDIFVTYTTNHPQIRRKEAPFKQPLLNFVYLLIRCIDNGRLDAFHTLCDLYKPSLRRDASFEKYLMKIGVLFFGAVPPSSGGVMGGMFGDLFTRLFQGFDDEDDETHGIGGGNRGAIVGGSGDGFGDVGHNNELD